MNYKSKKLRNRNKSKSKKNKKNKSKLGGAAQQEQSAIKSITIGERIFLTNDEYDMFLTRLQFGVFIEGEREKFTEYPPTNKSNGSNYEGLNPIGNYRGQKFLIIYQDKRMFANQQHKKIQEKKYYYKAFGVLNNINEFVFDDGTSIELTDLGMYILIPENKYGDVITEEEYNAVLNEKNYTYSSLDKPVIKNIYNKPYTIYYKENNKYYKSNGYLSTDRSPYIELNTRMRLYINELKSYILVSTTRMRSNI